MKKATNSSMRKGSVPRTIDSYLAVLPSDQRAALEKLRQAIKAAAPMAEEAISYRMPAFKYKGALVYFAAFKDHCSLFPASKAVVRTFANDLKGFRAAGATIHFTPEKPLPSAIVKKIVKARIEENEARAKRKFLKA